MRNPAMTDFDLASVNLPARFMYVRTHGGCVQRDVCECLGHICKIKISAFSALWEHFLVDFVNKGVSILSELSQNKPAIPSVQIKLP